MLVKQKKNEQNMQGMLIISVLYRNFWMNYYNSHEHFHSKKLFMIDQAQKFSSLLGIEIYFEMSNMCVTWWSFEISWWYFEEALLV